MRTPAAGTSFEVQDVELSADAEWTPSLKGRIVVHVLDLYNRNPTSSARAHRGARGVAAVGTRYDVLRPQDGTRVYVLLGKAPRFTKQLDRHLESYGLWGTAVGRFEQLQAQLGGSLGGPSTGGRTPPTATRCSCATRTRSPGTSARRRPCPATWIPSTRAASRSSTTPRPRTCASAATSSSAAARPALRGRRGPQRRRPARLVLPARPGGQGAHPRQLLRGRPRDAARRGRSTLDYVGRKREEHGANLQARLAGLRLFGQYVWQDLAGLKRQGFEVEVAYRIPLNGLFVSGDSPVVNWIQPAVRYSSIDNKFSGPSTFVAPSFFWDWTKLDAGLRVGIVAQVDLTVEYERSQMTLLRPQDHASSEGLATLRFAF